MIAWVSVFPFHHVGNMYVIRLLLNEISGSTVQQRVQVGERNELAALGQLLKEMAAPCGQHRLRLAVEDVETDDSLGDSE